MLGRDGTDTSYETETLNIGPGESYDVDLRGACPLRGTALGHDTYMLYNRAYQRSNNLATGGSGGAVDRDSRLPDWLPH